MTTTQAAFSVAGRNPDVLTCIANLSNDEVFTPPEFANRMLDTMADAWAEANGGENIWARSDVTFLDPFTKSGVFLREITSRLTNGLASEIPNLGERVDHILTKQVYGIGITNLTSLLARRSLYCSKWANGEHSIAKSFKTESGNIWFGRVDHAWVGGTEWVYTADGAGNQIKKFTNGKCQYCGVSQSALDRGDGLETHAYAFIHTPNVKAMIADIFGDDMQFDVIIGNPPYQLSDGEGGNGTSAAPIYQMFVDQARALEPRYLSMVVPARWFAGGKGLDEFRASMLSDNRTRKIHDYWLVGEVFPGVAIQGGICYFLWSRDEPGDCDVVTHFEGAELSRATRPLLEPGSDVFIRYNEAVPILKKIADVELEAHRGGDDDYAVVLPPEKCLSSLVSSSKPFGIRSNFKVRDAERPGDVATYWNGGPGFKQSGKGWASRSDLTDPAGLIDAWKVFIGKAYGDRGGGGASRDAPPKAVLAKPFVGEPGSASTETYLGIGPFGSRAEAENVCSYIACKFTRFLVMLQKPSQNTSKKVYSFVPVQDFSRAWTDEQLYAKYGLTEDEINFIEWMVRPMDLGVADG